MMSDSTLTLSNMATPLLSLRNVSLSYWLKGRSFLQHRRFIALNGISLDVFPGQSLGVVGRNGAGKSSLLRLMAGIVSPDSGEVVLKSGATASLLSLRLGLMPHLTGRENAIQGALFQGLNLKEFKEKLDDIKEFSGLGDFFEEQIYTYSSGMMARLSFSIAIQIRPTILLVDELLGVGDAEFREKAVNVMKERWKSAEQTVVFVSHNLPNVRELCSHVIWIENGILIEKGPAESVLASFVEHRQTV